MRKITFCEMHKTSITQPNENPSVEIKHINEEITENKMTVMKSYFTDL